MELTPLEKELNLKWAEYPENLKRRPVSSDEINKILHDKDCVKIANKVLNRYNTSLDDHTLSSCLHIAAWKCIGYWRPGFNKRFTSNLHTCLQWECRRELKNKCNKPLVTIGIPLDLVSKENNEIQQEITNSLSYLTEPESVAVDLVFYKGKKTRSVAKSLGITIKDAQTILESAMEKLEKVNAA
jgi:RNA polymerase sigma factor (sigma-70 family)